MEAFKDDTQLDLKEEVGVKVIKDVDTDNTPRIELSSVKTEEDALEYLKWEVSRRYRLSRFDNMIDKNFGIEIEDAIQDCMSEINNTPPYSNYSLLDMVKKDFRYRVCLIHGSARNAILPLWAEWSANGMSVGVEDLQLDNKTAEMKDLLSYAEERFNKYIEELKKHDKPFAKYYSFRTKSGTSRSTSFSFRVSSITRSGGRIG